MKKEENIRGINMNKYDNEFNRQKELRTCFNATKTEEEKNNIKYIADKFIQNKGITKEEYNKLIKYYYNIDLIDTLKYETYKPSNFMNMNQNELYILSKVIKACFILG